MKDDPLEIFALALKMHDSKTRARRWRLRRCVLHDAIGPPIVYFLGDMEIPVHRKEECHFVLVDLVCSKARYLAPSPSRVVPILEILRCQNESREEHSAATLQSAACVTIISLLHSEVTLGKVVLDQD